MPKQVGDIKITGTFEDLTFYKSGDDYLVRRKNRKSYYKKFQTDPKYKVKQELSKEFTNCSVLSGYIRRPLIPILQESRDPEVMSRLIKLLIRIKNQDKVSVLGERQVSRGLGSAEASRFLNNFEINRRAPLASVLTKPFTVDKSKGTILIPNLNPKKDLVAPPMATHVRFKAVWTRTDLNTGAYGCAVSPVFLAELKDLPQDVLLQPHPVPSGKGLDLYLLQVCFLREEEAVRWLLPKSVNAMAIVESGAPEQ